jgi:epoxyqueuosine reductase
LKKQGIVGEIRRFALESEFNRRVETGDLWFDEPAVGFASARDPIFRDYKSIIGDFHLTPPEIFEKVSAGTLTEGTVICWILPVALPARETNRVERRWPSLGWARTRTRGEEFNDKLRERVVEILEKRGYRAVAPLLTSHFRSIDDARVGLASTWSERHAAYAAGLGTFSLSDGLITERGIAHRCGSVVTNLVLAPNTFRRKNPKANCLHFHDGSCGTCMARCPAGAIDASGHDKQKCKEYVHGTIPAETAGRYDVHVLGCGLCQTDVPCEGRNPVR